MKWIKKSTKVRYLKKYFQPQWIKKSIKEFEVFVLPSKISLDSLQVVTSRTEKS